MALGSKTVQYTLAVDLETGQLSAESKKVANDLGLIQKKTKDADGSFLSFGRQAKQLKQELSLLFLGSFGGYALATEVLSDAIKDTGIAIKETFGQKEMTGEFDTFLKQQLQTLREIGLTQEQIVELRFLELESVEELTQLENERNKKNAEFTAQNWWKFLVNAPEFFAGMAANTSDLNYGISELNKTIKGTEDRQAGLDEVRKRFKDIADAADNAKNKTVDLTSALTLMRDLPGNPLSFLQQNPVLETRMSQNLNLVQPAPILGGGLPESPVAQLKTELDELVENSGIYQSFFLGLADGFASFGAALVESGNPLKNFGAMFLKLIANLAVQFGTFLILYGTGMGFVPGGQAFSSGAIAAGVALTVFGGALGALANKLGGVSSSRGEEREQRFRDSRFGTNGGNGGMTIINNINFANTIGLTRDAMKEVGEVVSAEIFKQQRLGIITQPA